MRTLARLACAVLLLPVALAAAGAAAVPVDAVAIGAPLAGLIETWRAARITHAISIERCGRSRDGSPRNMRGEDISAHTAPLDDLFTAGPWDTIAIGDKAAMSRRSQRVSHPQSRARDLSS